MRRITVLGATGSIGQNTLDVVARHPEDFQVFALTAHSQANAMAELCLQHRPKFAVMGSQSAASELKNRLGKQVSTQVLYGPQALADISLADESDVVMAAIVGAAGLAPTLAAIDAGKDVLLANKEALVMSGQLFIDHAQRSGARILPVDSEHNAIFQCLPQAAQQQVGTMSLAEHGIDYLLLTGSGGPFRDLPINQLAEQTPSAACKHPNWSMGQKISVDSATMLNKGLEYIEARWLFNCSREQLKVVIHPQSVIHSMVQYTDGSVLAQMGEPDMRTPIAHSLGYPERLKSGVAGLDFTQISQLTFKQPEPKRYPCLQLAIEACWEGQWATTALNAANEIAVSAFLHKQVGFTDIAKVCDSVLQSLPATKADSLQTLMTVDKQARLTANKWLQEYAQ
ncbi:1-deoxy-D-xylulose-5-phosphate reductoisomerase [Idiomarina sp. HP20-50]|uniref:1-deoxy-D-xylulose-5-phosphate reductoisomerase n=1 Tax=Idiomarina sp. HP20-50 TaxID=3070813 RepID=UPI00294B6B52|nr:1-deoxy-D-xylulose-5-phosphate reductoisomerase [Idiomarina sp. HP20-50]MDV6315372.1 1-deoxy-D-xylulose-5-phosphate reductoisomerase [Idiomarina sp. HP20-50]